MNGILVIMEYENKAIFELKSIFKIFLKTIKIELKADHISMLYVSEKTRKLIILESINLGMISKQQISFSLDEGLAGECYKTKKSIIVNDISENKHFKNFDFQEEIINSIVVYPIINNENEVKCIISITSENKNNFNEKVFDYLKNYALLILNSFNEIDKEEDMILGLKDNVTGLYNLNYLKEYFSQEIKRSERYDHKFSVLLMKIKNLDALKKKYYFDNLKKGLKKLGSFIMDTSRNVDFTAVIDYDKYIIVLPETPKSGAEIKLKRVLNDYNILKKQDFEVLKSFVLEYIILEFPEEFKTLDEILDNLK